MTASRAGTGLGALAALACVACCGFPVLITAGILSGGTAAFLAGSLPVIASVLAGAAVLTFAVAAHRKARGASCASAGCGSAGDSSCGCQTCRTQPLGHLSDR